MKTVIVIDTNVLLNDPDAIFVHPGAELIIPQTVLSELDKIKMSRSDREVRFRGREVSRILFELSEQRPLVEGIELDNDSLIRVVPYQPQSLPDTLTSKNADDRILGCAWQIKQSRPDTKVILLTNDLNMLLKAQTLGIEVKRHERLYNPGARDKLKRFFTRRRKSFLWAALPVILAGLFVGLWLFRVPSPLSIPASTSRNVLDTSSFGLQEAQYLEVLNQDPSRFTVWLQLGQLYLDWAQQLQSTAQFTQATPKLRSAIDAFNHSLSQHPRNAVAKTNKGTAYFFLGNSDEAANQYVQAIADDPNYSLARFNLGFVLFHHFRDFNGAKIQFEAYLKISPTGERSAYVKERLAEIEAQNTGPGKETKS